MINQRILFLSIFYSVKIYGRMEELMDSKPGTDTGRLVVSVTSSQRLIPINNAKVTISYTSDPVKPIEELVTNDIGKTEAVDLKTPPIEYSLEPEPPEQPYSNYTVHVEAEGYEPITIDGSELLSGQEAIQSVSMVPTAAGKGPEVFPIAPHTLYYEYPPKIAESLIKPVSETGEIVLSRVVIPEYVVVHNGVPSDTSAKNYYVRYADYIKNVVSSEIYATWPKDAIRANILAIMSFTLNRVYTEWYRNKGYNFTITSSTAFDQKWIPERNTYRSIDVLVDELFNSFLSKPSVTQPIFTWYCDGKRVTCENGMSQWGTKYLAEEGYIPIEILRYYYGSSLYINTADEISGVPASWPGYNLKVGSSGPKVATIQEQLNRIAQVYTLIPKLTVDGKYGPLTEKSVKTFQSIFNMPQTGIVDYPTWYRISNIFVGITRMAEPF